MLSETDLVGFERDLEAAVAEARAQMGRDDLDHLRRFERWSNICALAGLALAALSAFAPPPVMALVFAAGAVFIALGRGSRWILMHHISHGGYDRVPGVPKRYTSAFFGHGWRRILHWPDWITPEAWRYEHNILHHAYTGEETDPDLVERNSKFIRPAGSPMLWRYLVLVLAAATWRFTYYAPQAAIALHRGNPRRPRPLGWRLVAYVIFRSYLYYGLLHFVLVPALFLPLGPEVALQVLMVSAVAELLCNLHTCAVIAPNHTGEDLYRFDSRAGSRRAYYFRQVIGSVNMRCGGDLNDFLHLWLNYQIEHHLWPDLPMLRYRQLQPKVREICAAHGVPYVQESVWMRVKKTADVVVGRASMRRFEEARSLAHAAASNAPSSAAGRLPASDMGAGWYQGTGG